LQLDGSTFDGQKPCDFKNMELFDTISEVLQMDKDSLIKSFNSVNKTLEGKVMNCVVQEHMCQNLIKSFCKSLYSNMFSWTVKFINLSLQSNKEKYGGTENKKEKRINILDIFGFEIFKVNSFEQLCINFTNEKLHQLYIEYVFKLEEQIFVDEGLGSFLANLSYPDNQELLDVVCKETDKHSIFLLLDNSTFNRIGTDASFLKDLLQFQDDKVKQGTGRGKDYSGTSFIINHTAKPVGYETVGFLDKNKDDVSDLILSTIRSSKNSFIVDIYNQKTKESDDLESKCAFDTCKKARDYIGTKFRREMEELNQKLRSCQCTFMRCIKPNENKREGQWSES